MRAAVAGRIVGFGTWISAGEAVEMEDLFVDPDRRGQGTGRALVADRIAIARVTGSAVSR